MSAAGRTLSIWRKLSPWPGGKWLFAFIVCRMAPYFGTIRPRFERLEPGLCRIRMRKRRAVLNHIGSVHAIAMCNLAELAAGTMTDVTLPVTHRWIPKGMQVDYVHKAQTDLVATAKLAVEPDWGDAMEVPVAVNVLDAQDQLVLQAMVMMYITRKQRVPDRQGSST